MMNEYFQIVSSISTIFPRICESPTLLGSGEISKHVDFLAWEKGRESSFNAAALFYTKVQGKRGKDTDVFFREGCDC